MSDCGYIIDCRNNFRDNYLTREETAKLVWGEEARKTTRIAPAHAAYPWEIDYNKLKLELQDERWLWKHTILDIPKILRYHLGRTTYEIRPELVKQIREWHP